MCCLGPFGLPRIAHQCDLPKGSFLGVVMEVKYKGFLLIKPNKTQDFWQVRFYQKRMEKDYWADEDENGAACQWSKSSAQVSSPIWSSGSKPPSSKSMSSYNALAG